SGSRGYQDHPRPSADPRVSFRHVRGTLFMTHQDVIDFGVQQGIVGGQDGAARIAENRIDPLGDQAFNYYLRTGEFFHLAFSDARYLAYLTRRGLAPSDMVSTRRPHYPPFSQA